MKFDILICVLSWEKRFLLGLKNNIAKYDPTMVILFKYSNPITAEWKSENLNEAKALLRNKLLEIELDNAKPTNSWFTFLKAFSENAKGKNVLIDITTMSRESIWLSLYNCKNLNCKTSFIYYRPEGYSDWVSRDPDKPRLLYKMSGIAKLGMPSLLLITGGYDIQRLDSLIYNFEPKHTMLFFQNGDDPRNQENAKNCRQLLKKKYNIDLFYEYNAYDTEESYSLIIEKLMQIELGGTKTYFDSYNVILSSLGAKTSAITLFNIWLKFPQVALSYIPSKEYNREYSFGIGESYSGEIAFT